MLDYSYIGTGNSDLYGGWSYDGDRRNPANRYEPDLVCPECDRDIDHEEWRYCPWCGIRFSDYEGDGECS